MRRRTGETDAARRSFSEAIDIDLRTVPAYLNLGDMCEQQGNLGAAVDAEGLVEAE